MGLPGSRLLLQGSLDPPRAAARFRGATRLVPQLRGFLAPLLAAGLLGLLGAAPAFAGQVSVSVQSTYGGTFTFLFYRNRVLFDSTTATVKDGEKFLRVTVDVPENGCGYYATVVPIDPRFGPPQTTLRRLFGNRVLVGCANWSHVGWFASSLGTLTFKDSAPHSFWHARADPTDTERWHHEHPWVSPLIAGSIFGVLLVAFVSAGRLIGGPRYRVRPGPYRGRHLSVANERLLERYRLADTAAEVDKLHNEEQRYGYKAVVRSRPGLLDELADPGVSGSDPFRISQALKLGYAVRVSPWWRFGTHEVAFIELPELPTPAAKTAPAPGFWRLIDHLLKEWSYTPDFAKRIITGEAPPEMSYDEGVLRLKYVVKRRRAQLHPADMEEHDRLDMFERLLLDIYAEDHRRPSREVRRQVRDMVARLAKVYDTEEERHDAVEDEVRKLGLPPEAHNAMVATVQDELRREQKPPEPQNEQEEDPGDYPPGS